jgi:hypothetical protein
MCGTRKRRALLALVCIVAAIALALAGCGDLPLVGTLQGESRGDLRFSPTAALIPLGRDLTLSVTGGIYPYDIVSGAVTQESDVTWLFPAQTAITGTSEDFPIVVTDRAGKLATATVTVYALPPLELNVTEVTIVLGGSFNFTVTGGQSPYTWAVEGVPQPPDPDADPTLNEIFTFTPAAAGIFWVSVMDALPMSCAATVTVVEAPAAGTPLEITPTSAAVLSGGQLSFTALGGTGPYTFSAEPGLGTFVYPNANPATYTAPAVVDVTVVTVTLTDDYNGDFVTATVKVTVNPLTLFPIGPTVSAIRDTVQFKASGGTGPGTYTFTTGQEEEGTIDSTGLYTQWGIRNNLVTVKDAAGSKVNRQVKFK